MVRILRLCHATKSFEKSVKQIIFVNFSETA